MITERRLAHLQEDDSNIEWPLILSVLMHVLLGLGIWYISRPHLPKVVESMGVTVVTADMLDDMKAAAKNRGATSNAADDIPQVASVPSADPDNLSPSVYDPQEPVVQEPRPRIFEPVNEPAPAQPTEPKQSKPKESKPVKPLVGKPDTKGIEATKKWAEQQQRALEEHNKRKQSEERLKKRIEQRERDALATQKAKEAQALKEKRAADKKRLAEAKQAEREANKRAEERRKEIAEAEKKARERREAQEKAAAEARRKDKLAEGSKSLGGLSEFESEAKSLSGPTAAEISDAKATYIGQIQAKIKRNWTKSTDKRITVPVRIRLSPSGNVLAVNVSRSTGDTALDNSIESAIRNSSPLPVPSDRALFDKTFKSFTLNFRTE